MPRRLALVLGLLLSFSAIGRAQTVDDIIAKTIAAQGLDKLKSVQTMRMTATMTITPPGMDMAVVIENKRPMKVRETFTIQGTENIRAYDGQVGWSFIPAQGQANPQAATADDLKELVQEADIDGALVDYKAKGHKVELVGKEPVQGTDAWKLKVTLKDGDVQYQYIDAEHYLPIKIDSARMVGGAEVKAETFIGDYKDEGGVMMPHSIETKAQMQGTPFTQKITIQKVELNVPIDDARFKMPEVKK